MAKQPENEIDKSDKPTERSYFTSGPAARGWLYGLAAFIVLVLAFCLGAAATNHHRGVVFKSGNIVSSFEGTEEFGPMRHGFRTGGFGGNVTVNGQSRITGVVTSVNGSGFTVAGNGTTTSVTTNNSTSYQGGDQVKQNDTVVVFGTTSNNTLTATQIVINP